MVQLFKLDKQNKIHHLINFGDEFVLRNDEFISIEIGYGFDWKLHAKDCLDCKAFLKSIGKSKFEWALKSGDDYFIIDMAEFAKDDHFKNQFSQTTGNPNKGVKLKLKKEPLDRQKIVNLISDYEEKEDYESCDDLKNLQRLTKNQ